ncbi:MAG: right-handed parallel beta-helix repeat-containing protein [Candidatus Thiodiazotropha sp.]
MHGRTVSAHLLAGLMLLYTYLVHAEVQGIPEPGFGMQPVPTFPATWPSAESVGFYYVDPGRSAATDRLEDGDSADSSGNRYGYPAKPRATIPSSFTAGSVVVLSGTFSRWPQRIHMDGNEQSPVWFVGDPQDPPVFSSGERIFSGQHAIFDTLTFRDNAMFSLRNKDGYYFYHHAALRNFDMRGTGAMAGSHAAIGISGQSSSERASDILISNCRISYYGSYTGPTENDFHGIKPSGNVDNVWILNNQVHHNGGDSIQIGNANIPDETRPSHIYVGSNDFYSNFENDVDIKEADHVIVSSNNLHESGLSVVVHNNSADIWFLNNRIHDTHQGVDVTSGTNVNFVGNLFYAVRHDQDAAWDATSLYARGAAIHSRGGVSATLVNNTFHDYDIGVQIASVASLSMQNNLFSNRTVAQTYDVHLASSSLSPLVDFDFNLFYEPEVATRINWATGEGLDVAGISNLGVCGNCIDATISPMRDPDSQAFALAALSPAMDVGTDSEVYTRFQVTYGLVLSRDVSGSLRVLGLSLTWGLMKA